MNDRDKLHEVARERGLECSLDIMGPGDAWTLRFGSECTLEYDGDPGFVLSMGWGGHMNVATLADAILVLEIAGRGRGA